MRKKKKAKGLCIDAAFSLVDAFVVHPIRFDLASHPQTSMLSGTSANASSALPPNNSNPALSANPQGSSAGSAEISGVYQPSRRRVAQMFDLKQSEVLEGYK